MCDVGSKVELILSCLEGRKHPVRNIVLMEKPPVELITRAEQCGIAVTSMEEMEVNSLFGFIANAPLRFQLPLLLYHKDTTNSNKPR